MVLQANLASKRPPPGGRRPEPLEWGLLTSLQVQILPLTKLRSTAGIRICLTFTIVKPQIPWRPHLAFSAECLKSAQHTSILGLSFIPKVLIKLSFNYFSCVGPLCTTVVTTLADACMVHVTFLRLPWSLNPHHAGRKLPSRWPQRGGHRSVHHGPRQEAQRGRWSTVAPGPAAVSEAPLERGETGVWIAWVPYIILGCVNKIPFKKIRPRYVLLLSSCNLFFLI